MEVLIVILMAFSSILVIYLNNRRIQRAVDKLDLERRKWHEKRAEVVMYHRNAVMQMEQETRALQLACMELADLWVDGEPVYGWPWTNIRKNLYTLSKEFDEQAKLNSALQKLMETCSL